MVGLSSIANIALAIAHGAIVHAGSNATRPIGAIAGSTALVCFGFAAFGVGSLVLFAMLASALLALAAIGRVVPAWLGDRMGGVRDRPARRDAGLRR